MSSATPSGILAPRRHLLLNGDIDGFADLFAPDAVMESAFHGLPGSPPVCIEGREVIREYSRQILVSPLRLEDFEVMELHQAQDPEVAIADAGPGRRAMPRAVLAGAGGPARLP